MDENSESYYSSNQTMDMRPSSSGSFGTVRHARHALANPSRIGGQMLTPPPSATQTELTARMDDFSMNSPDTGKRNRNSGNKGTSMPSPPLHNQSIFAQNRAILLSGLPPSPPPLPLATPLDLTHPAAVPRSMRMPPGQSLTPLVISKAMDSTQQHPDNLYYDQSPRARSPCVYVQAVNLPQTNPSSSLYERTHTPPLRDGRLYFSALVRPSSPSNEPFAIQREFDLGELINAVPKPDRPITSNVSILPSPVQRSPLSNLPSLNDRTANPPAIGGKFGAVHKSPTPWSPYSRQSVHGYSQQQSRHNESSSPDRFMGDCGIPLPMLPHPNLGHLPALAAVILSGHVKAGDSIDLPLPHPEAWQQTVAYVYRGTGELTADIQRNIVHLGGRSD